MFTKASRLIEIIIWCSRFLSKNRGSSGEVRTFFIRDVVCVSVVIQEVLIDNCNVFFNLNQSICSFSVQLYLLLQVMSKKLKQVVYTFVCSATERKKILAIKILKLKTISLHIKLSALYIPNNGLPITRSRYCYVLGTVWQVNGRRVGRVFT